MIAQREPVKFSPIKVWVKPNGDVDEECEIECEIGCNNGVCKAVGANKWVKREEEEVSPKETNKNQRTPNQILPRRSL